MKACPFCGESIQDTAIKCRFCGEFLHEKNNSTLEKKVQSSNPLKKLWKLIENKEDQETNSKELDTSSIDNLFIIILKQTYCLNPKRLVVGAYWTSFFILFLILILFGSCPYPPIQILGVMLFGFGLLNIINKRLHDLNKNLWWIIIIWILVGILIFTLSKYLIIDDYDKENLISTTRNLLVIYMTIHLSKKGTKEENKYGPSPLVMNWNGGENNQKK